MADYGTEQNLRLAQQMLKQQGEINALRAERDALKAAIEPVRQHLAKIVHLAEFSPETKVGELLPLAKRLIATLDGAHSPADAPTAVSAATEAHGRAGEAQEG